MSEKHFGWQHKKIKNLFLGVAVATLTILGFVLLRTIEVRQDANKFAEADRVKQAVFEDLVEKMGETPTHIVEKDVCYNTEQGPYDNGRLWCQVASIAYYSNRLEASGLEESFEGALSQNGLSGTIAPSGKTVFYVRELPCAIETLTDIMAVEPGYYFPKNNSAKQALIVRCADRAKAKHYSYEP